MYGVGAVSRVERLSAYEWRFVKPKQGHKVHNKPTKLGKQTGST